MRIVAVVVTYNRLPLLQLLVGRLLAVDALSSILVIDNASTDGTGEWLATADVRHRTLDRNRGGAGGFHAGLRAAVEEYDADLVWLMDDDGLPEPGCLDRLLAETDLDFWGPLVVDIDEPARLVFPIRLPGGTRVVHDMASARAAAVDGRIAGIV
ncbi:glycosyltransferase, partial [Nocardioides pelophilus]|uniref:glycosyltransferase n=1 Tax=Nocardioides pelophilus TaxID=2172019 RepID=UPI0028A9A8A3